MNPSDTPRCFSSHMGIWMIDAGWAGEAMHHVRRGHDAVVRSMTSDLVRMADAEEDDVGGVVVQKLRSGVALVGMSGPMSKGGDPKFGGVSTVRMRSAMRSLMADNDVSAIVLSVDSPGGQVAGTAELADDIAALSAEKPVFVQVEDTMASAALWVGSQASQVAINRAGYTGSIGTVAVVEDTSEAYERAGVQVHVISTGPLKGAFTDGAPVTEDHLAEMRKIVDALNELFIGAVATGRGMPVESVRELATGAMYSAPEALRNGLADKVQGLDATIADAEAYVASRPKKGNRARALAAMGRKA